jgi:hypothetical protein
MAITGRDSGLPNDSTAEARIGVLIITGGNKKL